MSQVSGRIVCREKKRLSGRARIDAARTIAVETHEFRQVLLVEIRLAGGNTQSFLATHLSLLSISDDQCDSVTGIRPLATWPVRFKKMPEDQVNSVNDSDRDEDKIAPAPARRAQLLALSTSATNRVLLRDWWILSLGARLKA